MHRLTRNYTFPLQHTAAIEAGVDPGFRTATGESIFSNSKNDNCLLRRKACSKRMTLLQPAFLLVLAFVSFFFLPGHARSQGTLQGDTQSCAADQPCFNGAYQQGNTVIFQFTGVCCWDFYNVRFPQKGGGDKQVENKSGTFRFTDVQPNSVYRISVQGCSSHFLGHSTCTDWVQSSVTTAPATGSVSQPLGGGAAPPPTRPEPVKTIGRVNVGPVTPSPPSTSPFPICDSARSARARNSPAAPNLEAQCRAQGGDPSPIVKTIGRVNVGPVAPSTGQVSICDRARDSRARNSPVAPQLEAQCRAQGGDPSPIVAPPAPVTPAPSPLVLAAKGADIVSADALLSQMRDLEREGPRRDGFFIGVAIAADQTLWGPGKQAMLDSLPDMEKPSADRSAHLVVTRNANAKFYADGVRIAEQETRAEIIAVRSAEPAGYYTLGFDIAAGIFASIARGGAGLTAPNPGTISIRNSLRTPGIRGFDAAMSLYMAQ